MTVLASVTDCADREKARSRTAPSSFGASCSDGRPTEVRAFKPSHEARYRHAMAITSLLDIQLRPDPPADVETRITSILSDTRARPGLVSADVVRDLDDPRHLVVIEVWESLEADNAYRAWRATPEGANELRDLTAGQLALTRYEPTTI